MAESTPAQRPAGGSPAAVSPRRQAARLPGQPSRGRTRDGRWPGRLQLPIAGGGGGVASSTPPCRDGPRGTRRAGMACRWKGVCGPEQLCTCIGVRRRHRACGGGLACSRPLCIASWLYRASWRTLTVAACSRPRCGHGPRGARRGAAWRRGRDSERAAAHPPGPSAVRNRHTDAGSCTGAIILYVGSTCLHLRSNRIALKYLTFTAIFSASAVIMISRTVVV